MGNSETKSDGSKTEQSGAGEFVEGFRVLKVLKNGPGELAGLQPFFDFIVAADGVRLSGPNKEMLVKKIEATAGGSTGSVAAGQAAHGGGIQLTVYNSREDQLRQTTLYPSSTWGGNGRIGISIRHTSIASAAELVWHILEVSANSPASKAGLRPDTDYIVGSPEEGLATPDDFYDLVDSADKEIELYVYNVADDSARIVSIVPNPRWGGEGSLGCTLGFGLLHRIPKKPHAQSLVRQPAAAPHQAQSSPALTSQPTAATTQTLATAGSDDDEQIRLQQRLEAARARRLAAESEEAELALKLQQKMVPAAGEQHSDNAQQPELPVVEPFPLQLDVAPSPDSVVEDSSSAGNDVSSEVSLANDDSELQAFDPHLQPATTPSPLPSSASVPTLPSASSLLASAVPLSSQSLHATPVASPVAGTADTPSRLTQGRANIEQLAQKQRELTEKLRQLKESSNK